MGHASNLKKIRKYSINEIDPIIEKLKNETENNEIFKTGEEACKLIEAHFHTGRKDNKMYNKYRKEIDEILTTKIFDISMVKPKDKESKIETISKKPLNFIYTLIAIESDKINTLYTILKENIMPSWFSIEQNEDGNIITKAELNEESFAIKNEREKVIKIIQSVYNIISENKLYENIISDDRLNDFVKLVDTKLEEIEELSDSFEKGFYQYNYEKLQEILRLTPTFRAYIDMVYHPLEAFIKTINE